MLLRLLLLLLLLLLPFLVVLELLVAEALLLGRQPLHNDLEVGRGCPRVQVRQRRRVGLHHQQAMAVAARLAGPVAPLGIRPRPHADARLGPLGGE